jgi:L-aminopeptidase/D-esterase-like protein
MKSFNDTLTAISGLWVGHDQAPQRPTGCTVVLCPQGAVAGVEVRGAAPGTRETDLLSPGNMVQQVHGIALCGGSAFGLEAASGVMRWLEDKGHGLSVGPVKIPIVPAAVIFDLWVGDARIRPDAMSGYRACEAASDAPVAQGNEGAGAGATVGKVFGPQRAMKGGVGSAAIQVGEVIVAALVVCNALGDVVDPRSGRLIAGARQDADSLKLINIVEAQMRGETARSLSVGSNTTIGVVATNASLSKAQAQRLAQLGHDGLAHSIRPVHTPLDGDTLFGLATGEIPGPPDMMLLSTLAAEATARATVRAVQHAQSLRIGSDWWPAASALAQPG